MKKGTAMEGFIREDGTIRPIEHYDDTELRGKIQTNTDNISNLDSRVTELEEHGGAEDPTKADKVVGATAGNLASLDTEGNLQDSGKKPTDFVSTEEYAGTAVEFSASEAIDAILAEGIHHISYQAEGKKYPTKHLLVVYKNYGKPSAIKPNRYMVMQTLIDWSGIHNRRKLYIDEELTEPDGDWTDWVSIPSVTGSIVEGSGEALTSGGAYDALLKKANYYAGQLTIRNEGQGGFPVNGVQGVEVDLDDFIASTTAGAKYYSGVDVRKDSTVAHFPCLISWTESNNTKTVIILVSHYTFTASRNDSQGGLWDQKFTVVNNSSFFEVL